MPYQGHLSDGSSIQKHSAGGLYPYILVARSVDADAPTQWGVQSPGKSAPAKWFSDTPTRKAYDAAHATALLLIQSQRCATCANSAKHLLHPKCGLCDGTSRYTPL